MLFFKKKKAPEWKNLSPGQKKLVTEKISRAVKAQWFGPKYKLVDGTDQFQRERGMVEYFGEDDILDAYGRGKMLDQARNSTRNSPLL